MKPGTRLRWAWLIFWPALAFAQGGPPLVTDDPGTVEKGHWEINLAWTREHHPGETVSELPLVDINYGLSDHAHFKYEVSWLRLAGDGSARAGVSDSSLGVKWRFWDEDRHGVAVSTYPQLGFRTTGSSVQRGLSSGATTLMLPLQLQKSFGAISFNADLGYVRDSRSADTWFGGVAAGYEWRHWELLAEIHAEREVGAPGARVLLNAGCRRPLGKNLTLLFSLGRETYDRTERCATVSYLGLQLAR